MNGRPRAFPEPEFLDERQIGVAEGMDLRDYFAGRIIAGMFANPQIVPTLKEKDLVDMAYKVAELMMHRRRQ